MLILIDRDELRMVAAASNRKWINLVGYVDFPGKRLHVVDSLIGDAWTELDRAEMATLFTNMSGQPALDYADAIVQLRAYSESWPNYPKSESQLEKEAEAIYAEEQAELAEQTVDDHSFACSQPFANDGEQMRSAHQQTISCAEQLNDLAPGKYTVTGDAAAALGMDAAAQAQKAAAKASTKPEAPRQGITKRIWEIADALLAVTGSVGNIKEFRKQVIDRASAEGANAGTAATQFGKWKSSKGL